MRLLIAIPCMDTVRYEFAESLANLCKHLSDIGVYYDLEWHATSIIYLAREALADKAINDDYDYVLWLDSDMAFTPDAFDLLYGLKTPFATGVYRSRRSPYCFVIKDIDDKSHRVMTLPNDPFEVAACGFGIVLMQTSVLYQVRSKYMTMFTPTPSSGEDYAFCERWLQMGNKIIAHPDVRADHIAYVRLRCDDPSKLIEYKEQR